MKTAEELRAGNSTTMPGLRRGTARTEPRSTRAPKTRVAIIDPEPFFSFALQAQFERSESSFNVVGDRRTLGEAVDFVSDTLPNLLIIESDSDWRGAVAAIRAIRDDYPQVKVVVIAESLTRNQFTQLMGLGIAGCLSMLMEVQDFVSALALVSAGALIISPLVTETFTSLNEVDIESLTDSECRLLKLIVEGRTNSDLSRILCVSEATLKRQIRKLLLKLQVDNRVQAAVLAIRERLL